jgi:Protein of unknown function (DUF3168)
MPIMAEVASETLRRSIGQALAESSDLAALLGGVRIYDTAPLASNFPYITLGQSAIRDWSTGAQGSDLSLTLHVWSPFGGEKHLQNVLETIRAVLHDRPLLLADHRFVTLHHEFSEARLDPEGDAFHGIIRYRAAAMPAQADAA